MSRTSSSGAGQRWQEILRRVAIALQGREVGVCEADSRGRMHLLAASSAGDLGSVAVDEVEATLRELGEVQGAGRRPRLWVAGRLRPKHWCVTPVWGALPQPPPAGVERRSPERLTLELGGVCIGLIEGPDREATASGAAGPQALLASIAEQVPALLWTTDAALRVTSRSGSGPKSLELLPSRVVGASLLEQYDRGELPAESVDAHRQALAGKSVSYQVRVADRYYDVRVKPLRHEGGAIVGVVGLAVEVTDRERALVQARCLTRDITERKLQELALAQFKAMVESADDAVIGKTVDGIITSWNPAAMRLYGYAAEEVIGKPITLLAVPDRIDEFRGILERVRSDAHVRCATTYRERSGATR